MATKIILRHTLHTFKPLYKHVSLLVNCTTQLVEETHVNVGKFCQFLHFHDFSLNIDSLLLMLE